VVAVIVLAGCARSGSVPSTTTRSPATPPPVTTVTKATEPASTSTTAPLTTGDDGQPQVQAVKDYFRARNEATQAKNSDLIDPYADPDTPEFVNAIKQQIIQDYTTHRTQPAVILTTTLAVADSIGTDGRHQAAVVVDYTASDREGRPVVAHQVFDVVWNERKGRWLVFGTSRAVERPR
jgi:hypothetical protein